MSQPERSITRQWVEQVLTPYVRYAFSHELAYDEDISPKICAAIDFCMTKPVYPTDGSDLILERICHAVDFPYKDLAPDLRIFTDDLESMTKWLVRHAQIKGPFELLGRMNVASDAWQEAEVSRLEQLRLAARKEKDDWLFLAPAPPPKAAPSEDQIDPRLVLAMPGQYVGSHLDGTLTVRVEQYFREQIHRTREYQQMHPEALSWLRQMQQAAGEEDPQTYSQQNSGIGTSYQQHPQQPQHDLHLRPPQAASHNQHRGQSQSPYAPQGHDGHAKNGTNMPASNYVGMGIMYPPSKPATHAMQFHGLLSQSNTPTSFQGPRPPLPPHQLMQHFPVQPPAAQYPQNIKNSAAIPIADLSHLRGRDWSDAAEQRARDFRLRGSTDMNQHQHQQQNPPPSNMQPPVSMHQGPDPSTQPSSSLTIPFRNVVTDELPDHIVIPETRQGRLQHLRDVEMHMRPGTRAPGFVNHPGFSNVTSSFPTWQHGAR